MKLKHYFAFSLYINLIVSSCQNGNNVTYIEDIIKKQINESVNYRYPENATKYSANGKIHDYGLFDFIIVGGGSAGSVIANRLSQVKNWKILFLEAGSFGDDVTDIPNMSAAVQLSDYDWGYRSVAQKIVCLDVAEQKCTHKAGRGIGGSSLINGLVYARGNRRDFDRWAAAGNPGWSYDDVLPFFRKSENFTKTDRDATVDWEYHGSGGELNVAYAAPRHPLVNHWIEANEEKKYNIVDYNGKEQMGASVTQINTKSGKRADTGNAFIKGILGHRNMRVLPNSYVIKVTVRDNAATGVTFTHDGKKYFAGVIKEVVLSAGAIGTSKILLLSGVGPKEHLEEIGIKTVADLPVGTKLRDHAVFIGLNFVTNYTENIESLGDYIKQYLNGTGALTSPNYNGGVGFYQTKFSEPSYPDVELIMIPRDGFSTFLSAQLVQSPGKYSYDIGEGGFFSIIVVALHTKSTGSVRLRNQDPFSYPLIDSNLLSDIDNQDINTLYEGIKIAMDLVNSSAYARINVSLIKQEVPECQNEEYLTKEYWYCLMKYFTMNGYHDVSTCPMGPNPREHVVDHEAKVHNIEKLRIADGSIFPFTLSGHPSASCTMVGEKISKLIKLKYAQEIYSP